nr:ATP synthase F1 subunit delta [Ezakiella coagulans]
MARIGLTYAESLFLLSEEKKETEKVFENFKSFIKTMKETEDIRKFLYSPIFSKDDKKDLIEKILKDESVTFKNFIKVIIDKGRERYLDESFGEFKKLYLKKSKKVTASVETAFDLTDDQVVKIKQFIFNKTGKEAIVEQKINKDLIMGVRIFVLGQEIDLSLKGSFDRLEQNLKNRIEVSG